MADRASSRYAKFACSMCDFAGYTQPLLDAHIKLRGHGPVGGGATRPGPTPAPLLGQRPGPSALLGTYGSSSSSGSTGGRSATQKSRGSTDASTSVLSGLFNQQQQQQSRTAPVPAPLLATPGTGGATMMLTQDVVETTLAKFNLPPNAVPFKGLTSEEFLQRLEDELLKRMNPADIIKQKIDAIVHSAPSVPVGRSNQEQQQKQSTKTQQQSESPPPVSDTEELLAMALRHNDFKTARELTDLLEKEKELQSRKAALAKLIPKTSTPGNAPVKLGEEVNMAESFKQYWATKRAAGSGETSYSITEAVPSKRPSRWTADDPTSNPQQRPSGPQSVPSSPREFSFRKIELTPDSVLPCAVLTFMDADPTLFWIRQPDNETTFQLINQELMRLVQTGVLRSVERPAREGMGCIAIVNIENLWHHRVEVVEQLNNGDIRVRLVDDGRLASLNFFFVGCSSTLTFALLQALISNPDNLKYVPDADGIVARSPALGIPCSLATFQPNEQWRTTGEKCFNLFKNALSGAKGIKFVQKNQHGVYGIEVFSDKGQSLAFFLAQRGIGFVPPSAGNTSGFNNNGPPGPRLIRPLNGAGPMAGPGGPGSGPVAGFGPRGPVPLIGGPGPRPMGGFGGPMDGPRLPFMGRAGPMMANRPQFFDRQ